MLAVAKNLLPRFRRNEDGNFLTMFALSAPVVFIVIGVTVDVSHGVSEEVKIQAALDSAVLEGVKVAASSTQAAGKTAAQNMFSSNLSWTGPTASFNWSGSTLQANATYAMPTLFAGFTGQSSLNLHVASSAAMPPATPPTNPACILLLSKSSQAMLANSGANIQAPNCQIDVASTASNAAVINSGVTINASETCVASASVLQNGGAVANLTKSCPVPANPFLGALPAPVSTTCSGSLANGGNYNGGSVTLSPGVYCGWFNFNSAPQVTLQPGVYVIKNGGWNVDGGSMTGSGVTFYFADSSGIQFNSGMNLTLSPPATGTYAGILIYENDANTYTTNFVFDDSVSESLSGLIYLPLRNITFNSTSNETTPAITVVALTATFDTLNWSLTPNTTWQIGGSTSGAVASNAMPTLLQ
jgi:Flp pilus assembly protein TadG